jgi:hypothetical protein
MPRPKAAAQIKPQAPHRPGAEAGSASISPVPPRLWLRAASAALMGGLMGLLIDALLPTGRDKKNH